MPSTELSQKVENALNNETFTEQVKTTLSVAYELVKTFEELNEHYKSDMEAFNANHQKSEELYADFVAQKTQFESSYNEILATLNAKSTEFNEQVAKIEVLRTEISNLENSIEAMETNIKAQADEVKKLVNKLDIDTINAKITQLTQKAAEVEAYMPVFEEKKTEFSNYLANTKSDFEQYVAQFRNSLDELDFVQNTQPNTGLNGQSWLDTSTGTINIFSKNARVRFIQTNEPSNFARLGDVWDKGANSGVNELYFFESQIHGNYFKNLQMNALEFDSVDFKQENEPETANNEGKSWLKMSPLNVFYLENKSFVQIDKKLVRFTSDTEPDPKVETIQLNDIWKKSDSEIYICTSLITNKITGDTADLTEETITATWTLLELAYKTAKFKRKTLPSDSEIAQDGEENDTSKVQMRDLVFVVDEDELYYCLKTSYDGSAENANLAWFKKSEVIANARFKGESEPSELFVNDMWFQTKSDDLQTEESTQGTLKVLKPTNTAFAWKSMTYAKQYATFKTELQPYERFCQKYDIWYRPYSDELYVYNGVGWTLIFKGYAWLPVKVQDSSGVEQTSFIVRFNSFNAGVPTGDYIKEDGRSPYTLNQINTTIPLYSNPFDYADIFGEFSLQTGLAAVAIKEIHSWAESDYETFLNKITALSDDEVFVCIKVAQNLAWTDAAYQNEISAFAWQNDINKRLKVVESLMLPDGVLFDKFTANELIAPSYAHQVANVAFVNGRIGYLNEKISQHDNDFNECDISDGLNFAKGKNLSIDLTNAKDSSGNAYSTTNLYTLKSLQDSTALKEYDGQSGCIAIKSAKFLSTTFGEPFSVRVAMQGMTELEIFSYVVFDGKIRLTRS